MSLAKKFIKFIELTEKVSPHERRSKLWRREAKSTLKRAYDADLETRWKDEQDRGAHEVPAEEILCPEEPTCGADLSRTLEEDLARPQLNISKSSTAKTNADSNMPSDR